MAGADRCARGIPQDLHRNADFRGAADRRIIRRGRHDIRRHELLPARGRRRTELGSGNGRRRASQIGRRRFRGSWPPRAVRLETVRQRRRLRRRAEPQRGCGIRHPAGARGRQDLAHARHRRDLLSAVPSARALSPVRELWPRTRAHAHAPPRAAEGATIPAGVRPADRSGARAVAVDSHDGRARRVVVGVLRALRRCARVSAQAALRVRLRHRRHDHPSRMVDRLLVELVFGNKRRRAMAPT